LLLNHGAMQKGEERGNVCIVDHAQERGTGFSSGPGRKGGEKNHTFREFGGKRGRGEGKRAGGFLPRRRRTHLVPLLPGEGEREGEERRHLSIIFQKKKNGLSVKSRLKDERVTGTPAARKKKGKQKKKKSDHDHSWSALEEKGGRDPGVWAALRSKRKKEKKREAPRTPFFEWKAREKRTPKGSATEKPGKKKGTGKKDFASFLCGKKRQKKKEETGARFLVCRKPSRARCNRWKGKKKEERRFSLPFSSGRGAAKERGEGRRKGDEKFHLTNQSNRAHHPSKRGKEKRRQKGERALLRSLERELEKRGRKRGKRHVPRCQRCPEGGGGGRERMMTMREKREKKGDRGKNRSFLFSKEQARGWKSRAWASPPRIGPPRGGAVGAPLREGKRERA